MEIACIIIDICNDVHGIMVHVLGIRSYHRRRKPGILVGLSDAQVA